MPDDITEGAGAAVIRRLRRGFLAWCCGAAGVAGIVIAGAVGSHALKAQEQVVGEAPGPGALRVASWSLEAAAKAGLVKVPKPVERTWRHTFGAERRSQVHVTFDTRTLDADVVLLQDVDRIRVARRLFPAGAWKLIVSKEILTPASGDEASPAAPTTAIAVRYRRGLKVTAQEHLGELAAPGPIGHPEGAHAGGSAGTAVRVLVGKDTVWLVSVSLSASCVRPGALCPTRDKLEAWLTSKSEAGAPVVLGGRGSAVSAGATPLVACGDQAISFADPARRPPHAVGAPEIREADGCLVSAVVEARASGPAR